MKILTLIIHINIQQALTDQLRSMEKVTGYTFSHVEGHGIEVESEAFLSARDEVVGSVPRIRFDILLEDADVEPVLAELGEGEHSVAGQGVYWVTTVAQGGRL